MQISPSHESGGVVLCLPASNVGNDTSCKKRHSHEGNHNAAVGVEGGNVVDGLELDASLSPKRSDGLVGEGPEAPVHGCAADKTSAHAVEHHVGFPPVLHVARTGNLEEAEYCPEEEKDKAVRQGEKQNFLLVGLDLLADYCNEGLEVRVAEFCEVHFNYNKLIYPQHFRAN